MIPDLHNHTIRCGHAEGSAEEYIHKAIEAGIGVFGFSDHAPMDFDQQYRMNFDEMEPYESEIKNLADKYSGKIDIRLGYEVDWLPGHMDERVLKADVDYLIGSVHFLDKWGFDNPEFIGEYKRRDADEIWDSYFQTIKDMVLSGYFDIVGHLDLIKIFGYYPKKPAEHYGRSILNEIAHSDMVLEINTAGLRKPVREIYPSLSLLKMAFERNIPITFGSDAHKPDDVGYGMDEAVKLARSAGYDKAVSFKNRKRQLLKF